MKILVLALLQALPLVYSQTGCESGKSCNECIQIRGCAWCADVAWPDTNPTRCSTPSALRLTCQDQEIQNPEGSVHILRQVSPPPELSPQEITLTARVGERVTLKAEYVDTVDKPLDLYYVMDVSATMEDDKKTVAEQAENLASALKQLTKDVRFGFGTFVDKPIEPYASKNQIDGLAASNFGQRFEKTYAFRNQLKLTSSIPDFANAVKRTRISVNRDSPEGCLEALVQAIACTGEIGWRNNTRLIVLSTDGTYKMAGAAKMIGIIPPNDLKCHMEGDEYTHALKQDYPSLAQLRGLLTRTGVQVIFAVTKDVEPFYRRITAVIPRGITLLRIASDSRNIVEEVKQTYSNISSTVDMLVTRENLMQQDILVTSLADCPRGNPDPQNSGGYLCDHVTPNSKIRYNFTIELQKSVCNSKKSDMALVIGRFDGTAKLRVNIQAICECVNCANSSKELNDRYCSGNGEVSCGICKCKNTHDGKNCECSKNKDLGDDGKNTTSCENPMTLPKSICSNRGQCNTCGNCICTDLERYLGTYCEIDQDDCKRNKESERCSNQGKCIRGRCNCNLDVVEQTKFCNCLKSNNSCIEPGATTVCSGTGSCVCQSENVLQNSGPQVQKVCTCPLERAGKYCESCRSESCAGQVPRQCLNKYVINLVQCFKAPEETKREEKTALERKLEDCNKKYSSSIEKYRIVASYNPEQNDDFINWVECPPSEKDGCTLGFSYEYGMNGELQIHLKNAICPENKLWYILYVAGPLLLIGVLTIITWKVCTSWIDKKEFQRFEKERQNAQWAKGQNDLYVPPFSEFSNPAFRKSSASGTAQ